jgi:hypothetical protein
MPVVEAALILPYSVNAYKKTFCREGMYVISSQISMNSFNHKGPVHHFIAVQEMATEDEFESCVIIVSFFSTIKS